MQGLHRHQCPGDLPDLDRRKDQVENCRYDTENLLGRGQSEPAEKQQRRMKWLFSLGGQASCKDILLGTLRNAGYLF